MDKLLSLLNLKVVGALLGASLLANVFLFWGYTHQTEKKAECTQAVVVAKKVATEKKNIIENRQDKVTNETEDHLRATVGALRNQLQDVRSQLSNLPKSTDSTPRAVEEGREALVLRSDQLICTINTDIASGWQSWWLKQVEIRKEENATNPEGSSVPSQ